MPWNHKREECPALDHTSAWQDGEPMLDRLWGSWWSPLLTKSVTKKHTCAKWTLIWHSRPKGVVDVSATRLQSPDPTPAAQWHQLISRVGVLLHGTTKPSDHWHSPPIAHKAFNIWFTVWKQVSTSLEGRHVWKVKERIRVSFGNYFYWIDIFTSRIEDPPQGIHIMPIMAKWTKYLIAVYHALPCLLKDRN